ncbi:MAG TPA: hypothetical protein VLX67_04630 [Stellaceae bacterium]|nr:hypothetical protein [Stellaceae bacterium]
MRWSKLRWTKIALLVFGAGGLLGLAVVSVPLPRLARVASAAMALSILALPATVVADWRRKSPVTPARRRRYAGAKRRTIAPQRRKPRRR